MTTYRRGQELRLRLGNCFAQVRQARKPGPCDVCQDREIATGDLYAAVPFTMNVDGARRYMQNRVCLKCIESLQRIEDEF